MVPGGLRPEQRAPMAPEPAQAPRVQAAHLDGLHKRDIELDVNLGTRQEHCELHGNLRGRPEPRDLGGRGSPDER